MPDSSLIEALAEALLAGEPSVDLLHERCRRMLGRRWRWIRSLAERYVRAFDQDTRPRRREVVRFLRSDVGLQRAVRKYRDEIVVRELLPGPRAMLPVPAAAGWHMPAIDSTGDLAKWLGVDAGELRWFADLKGLGYKQREPRLEHYHYRVLAKGFDSLRLIEARNPG